MATRGDNRRSDAAVRSPVTHTLRSRCRADTSARSMRTAPELALEPPCTLIAIAARWQLTRD